MTSALRNVALALVASVLAFSARADAKLAPLDIVTSTGTHRYEVEIANDNASRERGLMYRHEMPANHGMLFEFPTRAPVTFWMKNTYLPLDMVFIDADGTVRGVYEHAAPLSKKLISSDVAVVAVLELNADQAFDIHLKPGDKVRFPFFHSK
ncbi:MAG TPA: DUF192 domain-containing protein [Roseiarcus sp.]|nr:DUF192 domain-containing protein [Roseiarcus sp.]